jgi:hypothetical protein
VHDGGADGGHYFTLIKDHKMNRWRKFNDSKIDFIDEDEVFKQANGGFGAMTAFWVFYLSPEEVECARNVDLYNIELNTLYSGLVDKKLKQEVSEANEKFYDEIDTLKAEPICKDIYNEHSQKILELH